MAWPHRAADDHRGLIISLIVSVLMPVTTEIVWPKARVTRVLAGGSDTIRHRRVRFVFIDGVARIYEHDGSLTLEAKLLDVDQPTSKSLTAVSENGEAWSAEVMGCNCGGG
jgi:hypothetical protein